MTAKTPPSKTTSPPNAALRLLLTLWRWLVRMRRRWMHFGFSLSRKILLLNILALLVPVFGLLHLEQYRLGLIVSELEAMDVQARAFSLSIGSTAVVSGRAGDEQLAPELSRAIMRVMLRDVKTRARIFAPDGGLLGDSFDLFGSEQMTVVKPLPEESFLGDFLSAAYHFLNWLPSGNENWDLYQETVIQKAWHYSEASSALRGYPTGMVRQDGDGRLVLSVAVPIRRYRQVLGALMLSKGGQSITQRVLDHRHNILIIFGISMAATIFLSLYLARTLAQPLRRLSEAASKVRQGCAGLEDVPDYSRRKDEIGQLSEAFRDMTKALWGRMDAIKDFVADVAHEIRNPLASLRSAVETISCINNPEQQKKLMAIILDDIQRLDRLINDISDASCLDAELSRTKMESVNLNALLQTFYDIYRISGESRNLRFDLVINRDKPLMVRGIESRLGQVFTNLLSNAGSFAPDGSTITLTAFQANESEAVILVEDEGPGIPEENLTDIFERFYSERPAEEKFGIHSGLGLSISLQIIEAHNGTIRAENRAKSNSNKTTESSVTGTRFIIHLPLIPLTIPRVDEKRRGR